MPIVEVTGANGVVFTVDLMYNLLQEYQGKRGGISNSRGSRVRRIIRLVMTTRVVRTKGFFEAHSKTFILLYEVKHTPKAHT